jgi:Mn-containing catalase
VFSHHEELAYTVRVDKSNPVFARLLQQAIGGPEGEMRVMNQYLFQAWGTRGPKRYRDMLLHTGTEEIGHIEPEDAAWASGEAPDGGRFSVVDAPRLGQEPELAKAPMAIHAGPEATRPDDDGSDPGLLGKAKQAVDQIAGG